MITVSADDKKKALRKGSVFMWTPNITLQHYSQSSDKIDRDSILWNLQCGVFTEKDFYLLKSLYMLGVTTVEALKNYILSDVKSGSISCPLTIKEACFTWVSKRIQFLARNGLVGQNRFRISGKDVAITDAKFETSYFVSYEGYTAVKSHYMLPDFYGFDKDSQYLSIMDVFRRLATKNVAMSLANRDEKVKLYGEYRYARQADDGKKTVRELIYSQAVVTDKNDEKVRLIFEPMFYSCDPLILNLEDNAIRNAQRLSSMQKIVESYNFSGEKCYLIIVLENLSGLQQFDKMVSTYPSYDFFNDYVYFTSDNIVCEFLREDFDAGLLKGVWNKDGMSIKNARIFDV